ncbi:MAG: ECF transporter S component [Clostridiales bacterium]|nr:ECF transporter S component [Clostridiales bacterium]
MNTVKSPSRNPLVVTIATAMLGAIAFVLMMLEFPLPLFVPYLKMDFGDVPAVLGAVLFGPWCGIAVELIKNLLEMLVRGLGTQLGFGNLQNFLIGCSYMLPLALIFRRSEKRHQSQRAALAVGSALGLATMLAVGFFSNLVVAPLFFAVFLGQPLGPGEAMGYALITFPFNAIKAVLITAVVVPLLLLGLRPIRRMMERLQ